MFCVSCGKHSGEGWKFCRHCGKPLPGGGEESVRDKPVKPPTPKLGLCYNYNGKGCEKRSGCIFIHMCKNYVESKCESGRECSKIHDILHPDVKVKLVKHGIDTKRRPKEILADLREAVHGNIHYSRETEDGAKGKPTRQASQKIDICNNYNAEGCKRTNHCSFIHMCKNYVESKCESGRECSKSHDILHPDVKAKLEKYGIDTKRRPKEILAGLREAVHGDGNRRTTACSGETEDGARGKTTKQASQKIGLCNNYNAEGCKRTNHCTFIHMCKNYVESKCESGRECRRSHDILHPDVKAKLEKHGINTKQRPREILADLRESVNGDVNRKNTRYSEETGEFVRGQSTKQASPKLGICYNYNGKGCEKTSGCIFIHMCKNYIESKCASGRECSKSHDLLNPDVKAILKKHGIDTKRRPKEMLVDLREAVRGDGDQRVSGDSAQSRGRDYSYTAMPPTICYFYISQGNCRMGKSCVNVHSDLPYEWRWKLQYKKPSSWQKVSSRENVEIENKYCDPAIKGCKLHNGQGFVLVEFNSMTGQDDAGNVYSVQRLSTASSLQYEHKPLTTVWIWYWRDENGKIKKYGNKAGLSGKTHNVSSSDIEQAYINNPDGKLPFKTTDFEYVIDFSKMVQRNVRHGTEREIVRRPIFLSESDVKELKHELRTGSKASLDTTRSSMVRAPTSWQIPSGEDIVDHYKMVQLTSTDNEYRMIEKMFHKTLPSTRIKSIKRIENGDLWWNYESKRQKMLKKMNESQVGERRLFHGTKSQFIDPIWHQGFDFRLSGQTSGTVFGQGSYFALNASYSASYTEHGSEAMFVVKVLPGQYVQGKSEYKRPPHKEEDNMSSDLFDSCVNNEANPDIFIIFHNDEAYPEYLIRY